MSVTICPTALGFPMRRKRVFTFGIEKSKWVWVGPTDPPDVQAEFEALFGAQCELPGDIFLQAQEEDVHAFARWKASQRKRKLPEDFENMPMRSYLPLLLPPGAMVRLSQYDKARRQKDEWSGCFLADLDHNIDCGPGCGHLMPALDTHPNIFSFTLNRLAIGEELLQAQGVDFYPVLSGNRGQSPLTDVFNHFHDRHLRFFAGNAIHIPAYFCWILYCLGSVRPAAELHKLPASVGTAVKEEESDDEDDSESADAAAPRCKKLKRGNHV